MNKDIINTIILGTSFLALFAVAELIYHFKKVKAELTRKLVHFGTGIITLLFPIMVANHWLVLFLCTSFALLLVLSLRYNLLRSINAIDRQSIGSIAYPISVYVCYFVYEYNNYRYYYFYLPILILAICDPIAALCGKKWPIGRYAIGDGNKTIMGSGMFFISALLICFFLLGTVMINYSQLKLILIILSIGLISTLTEAISKKGSDNLTIPLSVLGTMIILEHYL